MSAIGFRRLCLIVAAFVLQTARYYKTVEGLAEVVACIEARLASSRVSAGLLRKDPPQCRNLNS
jgi:hypothetical protein